MGNAPLAWLRASTDRPWKFPWLPWRIYEGRSGVTVIAIRHLRADRNGRKWRILYLTQEDD
jgi:hypothetical protein